MMHISGDLGKTATYSRREYVCLAGLGWPDGRDATCWFQHIKAKRRRNSKATVSRYGVSEVKEVGYIGRAFVWDKEMGEGEHGEPGQDDRKPPYTVRIDQYGEIRCTCMAGVCKAPVCRHCDATLILLDEGVFSEQLQGA